MSTAPSTPSKMPERASCTGRHAKYYVIHTHTCVHGQADDLSREHMPVQTHAKALLAAHDSLLYFHIMLE